MNHYFIPIVLLLINAVEVAMIYVALIVNYVFLMMLKIWMLKFLIERNNLIEWINFFVAVKKLLTHKYFHGH